MSKYEGGYEVVKDVDGAYPEVTIRCRESGRTMTMWPDEARGVGRVLAADDIAALTAEVERLRDLVSRISAALIGGESDPEGPYCEVCADSLDDHGECCDTCIGSFVRTMITNGGDA